MVGLSSPRCSGLEAVSTSLKEGELSGFESAEVLELSSCSPGLASASFHSAVSVSRVTFQELVAAGKVTEIARTFSTLKKSLLSHCSGFVSRSEERRVGK